jgi:hypothetical protein
MKRLPVLFLPLLTLFAGCAVTPVAPDCTPFGRNGQVCLLAPAALPAMNANHLISITRDGQQDTFMGLLQIDEHKLQLVGSSLFGTTLFSIEYDGHVIESTPQNMAWHPDMLVMMLELALADPARLEGRLHDLTLKFSDAGQMQVRELYEHGHLIARIEKTGVSLEQTHIHIDIQPLNLSVQITPLDGAVSPP